MGRHSDPSEIHFYRSIAGWFLPWILLAAVVGIVVWVGVDVLGNDDIATPETGNPAVATSPLNSPEPSIEAPEPSPEASPKAKTGPKKKQSNKKKTTSKPKQPALITEDITVQVLNATQSDPDADDRMADKLAGLGYDVIALGSANRVYQQTTVFWSFPAAKKAAERLADRFGWVSAPKPTNLSNTVDFHVIVGQDF